MPNTGKGIYIKSNPHCHGSGSAQLTNLRYEHVNIHKPVWWAIWIGPQQQHQPHHDLGLKCSLLYPLFHTQCPTQGCADFENITLKDVVIDNPLLSPGAILGNVTNPMRNLVFDNVTVQQDSFFLGKFPWHESSFPFQGTYKSQYVSGTCVNCNPVPKGFATSEESTRRRLFV